MPVTRSSRRQMAKVNVRHVRLVVREIKWAKANAPTSLHTVDGTLSNRSERRCGLLRPFFETV